MTWLALARRWLHCLHAGHGGVTCRQKLTGQWRWRYTYIGCACGWTAQGALPVWFPANRLRRRS